MPIKVNPNLSCFPAFYLCAIYSPTNQGISGQLCQCTWQPDETQRQCLPKKGGSWSCFPSLQVTSSRGVEELNHAA